MIHKEKDLEELLIKDISLIEDGMVFVDNQVRVESGIIDILARDKNKTLCVIELKVVSDCKEIIWQSSYYPTCFNEPTRVITIAPEYDTNIYLSLCNIKNVEILNYEFEDNILTINPYVHNQEKKQSIETRLHNILKTEASFNDYKCTTIHMILYKIGTDVKDVRTIKKYLFNLYEKGIWKFEEISEMNDINLITRHDIFCYSMIA